ncbi:DUF748 domain-containing protein [Malonomonas rubra]|uniref:DUF748 domain-containing protein n=1 Tax=Malonomonas rubra TaxID=57040 RepID=UPI0026EC42A8|nr:DUF748 domain-containing protein [Malonomonas rubra]
MPRWKKYSLISIGSILGLLLLSMLIVPWQIKAQGSKWFAENTTRKLSIEKAYFNPFTLTVEVKGVKLTEQQSQQTFVAFDRLMFSGSVRSLIDLAIILDRVELDAPYVNIVLLGKQEFNFSDFSKLGEGKPQPVQDEPAEPLMFSFNNIVLRNGKIDFTDQTSEQKSHHQISELSLAVPFIGNVSYLTDEYVKPQIRLLLNGSEIRAVGQLKPFHKSLETSLSLVLNEINLAFYAFHSPFPLPMEVESGVLDTQIDLSYRISTDEEPKLLLNGELALSDIDIRLPDDSNLFRMPTLILELDWCDIFQQDFKVVSLDIYEPELFVNRNTEGEWNFQQLLSPAQEETVATAEATERAEPDKLPALQLAKLALFNGKVHFQDQFPPGGVSEELHGINLHLYHLSTLAEQKTGLSFRMTSDRETTTELSGEFGVNPPTAAVDLVANGILLEPYYPYLAKFLTAPISGVLNLATRVNYTADSNIQAQQAQLALHELKVPFAGEDQFTLANLHLTGGNFDLQQRKASLAKVELSNGRLQASRLADGSLSPLKLLRPQPELPESFPESKTTSAPQFAVKIDQIELSDFDLGFVDQSLTRKPELKIDDLNINLADLAYPKSLQSPFKIKARLGKKGSVALTGKVAHSPLRVQAQTQVKELALADFNDFLPENVNVRLKDGKFYTNMAVKMQEQPETFAGSFAGSITIGDFNLRDPLDNGELLTWNSLNLNKIKGELAPFKLAIEEVVLSKYMAKIQIDQEGRVNLANVTAAEQSAESEEQPEAEPEPVEIVVTEEPDEATPPPHIRIDALTLQGGTVSFTDRSMPTTFSATMYELGGRVTGMASEEEMQADVDLRGELENHSPLSISGKLNPLSKDLFADLTIKFKDIDLAPMTPYSGTYLGKVIDKGKLYLDLSYHIEHNKIKADNQIMIDQFTFGDPVKSDKATSLPVGLAIALLKDSNDEIHLDVPISGDLNDPSFSIMGTIFTVLKNLLVKAATSPFSLLASMLGGGDEDFTSQNFDYGLAKLDEKQTETLGKLAEMLEKRPSLILELSAYADPANDPEAYRKEQLRQKMIDAKWLEIKDEAGAPQSRELVEITPEDYPEYLLQVYEEADFPRPRNFVGLLKKLPEPEMEKLLLANIRADDAEMQALAQKRALQVQEALLAENEEIKPRIFLKTVDIYQPAEKGPNSRVEFNISSK